MRHGDLRVAREFARRSHASLQFLANLSELRRHRLHQMVDLCGHGLPLQRQRILHLLAHLGKLFIRTAAR